MKNFLSPGMIITIIVAIVALSFVAIIWGSYNSLVSNDENVGRAWANVEAQYQRRFDLIPNLVNVVQSYAGFERDTLTDITRIRSQWQTSSDVNERVETANQFESTLSKLLLITENYPQLRSSEQFIGLQDSLSETENMVAVARIRYNDAVRDYNVAVRAFPSNVVAGWFGFELKNSFDAPQGTEAAPVVDIQIP